MIALDPDTGQSLLTQLAQFLTEAENQNIRPVLVCAPQLRAAVRRMVRPALPSLAGALLPGADRRRPGPLGRRGHR